MKLELLCPKCGFGDWSNESEGRFKCVWCGEAFSTEQMTCKPNESFASVSWYDEDIEKALDDLQIDSSTERVMFYKDLLKREEYVDRLCEAMIASGWDVIHSVISEAEEKTEIYEI